MPDPSAAEVEHGTVAEDVARRLISNLRAAMAGQSLVEFAERVGIDAVALGDILDGLVWPDLEVIARIEVAVDMDIWPGRSG